MSKLILTPAQRSVWYGIVCDCEITHKSSINVANIPRRNAILAVDKYLREMEKNNESDADSRHTS